MANIGSCIHNRQLAIIFRYYASVCRYEDLKADTYGEVRKMLDFLKIDYTPELLRKNLADDFTAFKR